MFLCASASAFADPLLIDGVDNNWYSGDSVFAALRRYQQVYQASQFGTGVVNISSLQFVYSEQGQEWSAGNVYRMRIGIANGGVNNLSNDQESNLASSQVFSVKTFTGTTHKNNQYGFTGSYDYDTSLGDLIIDIELIEGETSGINSYYNNASGGEFSRTYRWPTQDVTHVGSNHGLISYFGLGQANGGGGGGSNDIPEPATFGLAALALLGAATLRRRSA